MDDSVLEAPLTKRTRSDNSLWLPSAIMGLVMDQLRLSEVAKCMQVCKDWHRAKSHIRYVTIGDPWGDETEVFPATLDQAALAASLTSQMPRLVSLSIEMENLSQEAAIHLVSNFHHLVQLRMAVQGSAVLDALAQSSNARSIVHLACLYCMNDLTLQSLHPLTSLIRLDLHGHTYRRWSWPAVRNLMIPGLKELTVGVGVGDLPRFAPPSSVDDLDLRLTGGLRESVESDTAVQQCFRHWQAQDRQRITILAMSGGYHVSPVCTRLLDGFANLISLFIELDGDGPWLMNDLLRSVSRTCVQLLRLRLFHGRLHEEDVRGVADIGVGQMKQLRSLELTHCDGTYQNTARGMGLPLPLSSLLQRPGLYGPFDPPTSRFPALRKLLLANVQYYDPMDLIRRLTASNIQVFQDYSRRVCIHP